MFELFSDIFTYRENALTRIDPRATLAIALGALAAVVTSEGIVLPLAALVLCLGGAAALRIPLRLAALRLAAPLAIVAVLIVLKGFLTGATPLFSFTLGAWTFTAKAEGFREGGLLGARVLGALAVVFLLSVVTPAHRIFQALRRFGLSRDWLEIAILMYRYIFVLMDRAAALAAAQRLRLGYGTPRRALASSATLAGATILRSIDQAERTHAAMRLRGYRGAMPFGPLPALHRRDRWILILALGLIGAARLAEWGAGR